MMTTVCLVQTIPDRLFKGVARALALAGPATGDSALTSADPRNRTIARGRDPRPAVRDLTGGDCYSRSECQPARPVTVRVAHVLRLCGSGALAAMLAAFAVPATAAESLPVLVAAARAPAAPPGARDRVAEFARTNA